MERRRRPSTTWYVKNPSCYLISAQQSVQNECGMDERKRGGVETSNGDDEVHSPYYKYKVVKNTIPRRDMNINDQYRGGPCPKEDRTRDRECSRHQRRGRDRKNGDKDAMNDAL